MIKSFNKIKCKKVKTGHNPVCILTVRKFKIINNVTLLPGKYILKNISKEKISNKDIQFLKKLSQLELILHILFIDKNKIIMQYFDGITLSSYLKKNKLTQSLFSKIKDLIYKWHRKNYAHGDSALLFSGNKLVGGDNLLIGKDNVILIDPTIGNIHDKNNLKLSQFELKKKYDIEFLKELKFYIDRSINQVKNISNL